MCAWDAWPARFENALRACGKLGGECRQLVIEPPATTTDLIKVEKRLCQKIPASLAAVFTGFSRSLSFTWFLPDGFQLPTPFDCIFSGGAEWELRSLPKLDEGRYTWVEEMFPNADDPYDGVWHRVLSFMEVGNGDILAIDTSEGEDGPVVYVSHEGDEFHGTRLGFNFIDFIDRWSRLGCVGAEDWQLEPFVSQDGVLDPGGAAAAKWRELFGIAPSE